MNPLEKKSFYQLSAIIVNSLLKSIFAMIYRGIGFLSSSDWPNEIRTIDGYGFHDLDKYDIKK